jgi:hypothetical protein
MPRAMTSSSSIIKTFAIRRNDGGPRGGQGPPTGYRLVSGW